MSERDYADSERVRLDWETVRDTVSYRPDATWTELAEHFHVRPASLRRHLLNHPPEGVHLAERINKASGVKPRGTAYLDGIIRLVEADPDLRWEQVLRFAYGRTQTTINTALYRRHRGDLVRRLNENSRRGF